MRGSAAATLKRRLFALAAAALAVGAGGLALAVAAWGPLREAWRVRAIVRAREANAMLGSTLRDLAAEGRSAAWIQARAQHLRACYLDPSRVDLDAVGWIPRTRPAPFVGYLPEPGPQPQAVFNAHQLRDRRELTLPKPPGTVRIFLVGGSLAYGAGAPDESSTIAAFLQRELQRLDPWPGRTIEVWNAAVPGWASTQERINIENRLAQWEPDWVVALTGVNDVHWGFLGRDLLEFRSYEEEMYLELMNSAWRAAGAPPLAPVPPRVSAEPTPPDAVARAFAWNARLAAAALARVGARYALALQPTLSPHAKPLAPGERAWLEDVEQRREPGKLEYLERCYAAMEAALAQPPSADLRLIELRDAFAEREDPVFLDLYHVGDKGNLILAQRLAQALAQEPAPAPR